MSFTFFYPQKAGATTTVTLRNPERDNMENRLRPQAFARARGGTPYVYEKGPARIEASYEFADLDDDDKSALQGFFDSQAVGQVNAFAVDDHHGRAWTARFLQNGLDWKNTGETTLAGAVGLWSVAVTLELS